MALPTPATTRSTASASKPKYYPGQARPKPPAGPGTPPPRWRRPSSAAACASRRRRRRPRTSTPLPPAMAGTVPGQPLRKRLKIDDDPFGAVGDYVGSFLVKSRGRSLRRLRHQSRPPLRAAGLAVLRRRAGISRGVGLGAPRRGRRSARLLHRLRQQAARRTPTARRCRRRLDIDRPNFIGHIDGRLDVSQGYAADRAGAAAGRDRQSRQPEHPGGPRAISDLHHGRRHLRLRPELQSPAGLRRRHRRPHRSISGRS